MVGGAAVANAVPLLPVYGGLSRAFSGVGAVVVGGAFGAGVVSAVLSVFLEWIVFAGLFHLLSLRFGARGEFRALFRAVGWGFLPAVVRGLAVAVFAAAALQSVPAGAGAETFTGVLEGDVAPSSRLIIVATRLWQAVLWTFAVASVRELPVRQAGVVVGGPTAGLVVYNLAVAAGFV